MFSPDDLTPALVALPFATFVIKQTLRSSLGRRLFAAKPGYCRYLPFLCYQR